MGTEETNVTETELHEKHNLVSVKMEEKNAEKKRN